MTRRTDLPVGSLTVARGGIEALTRVSLRRLKRIQHPPCKRVPGGIRVGTDPTSVMPVPGLVAETGALFFSAAGAKNAGVHYVRQFIVDGHAITPTMTRTRCRTRIASHGA